MWPILKHVAHWLLVVVTMAIFIGLGGIAEAHSTTSRVWNMREIALRVYGETACNDTMTIPIIRAKLAPGIVGLFDAGDGGCVGRRVLVADKHWTTEALCRVIAGHELGGHAHGWRAPPGEEYVRPDGTLDPLHSNDPMNIMWPFEIDYWAPCANGAADTARRAS